MTPAAATHRILIADDQPAIREALRLLLKNEGYPTELFSSPDEAFAALQKREYALAFLDLNYTRDTTSGQEGLDLLTRIQALESAPPVIVMTAWATIDLAVEAMRRGAGDFIQKPWDNPRVLAIVRTQLELARTQRRNQHLEAENDALRDDCGRGAGGVARVSHEFVARSAVMRPVLELIQRVGPSDANVLITGENGTGKSLIAQALHAASDRVERAFISVNMGGLSEGVFESEFFGHVKGAFTDAKADRVGRFELADQGTLFLDEIANVPMAQQNRLLRMVETGEFERVGSSKTRQANVRLISATNADLTAEVAAGRFRQDLLFRLNTIEIHLPALRDRRDDILPLAEYFLVQHSQKYRKKLTGFEDRTGEALLNHPWPGNVRELGHVVERAVLMAGGSLVSPGDLGLQATRDAAPRLDDMSLEEVERYLIKKTLARFGGSARQAAEALGLSRSAFYRRLQDYGL